MGSYNINSQEDFNKTLTNLVNESKFPHEWNNALENIKPRFEFLKAFIKGFINSDKPQETTLDILKDSLLDNMPDGKQKILLKTIDSINNPPETSLDYAQKGEEDTFNIGNKAVKTMADKNSQDIARNLAKNQIA